MICDANKPNESGLDSVLHVPFVVCRALFWWKPHQNWTYGSKDISAARNNRIQRKFEAIVCYLKSNTGEFQLILLDHITYETKQDKKTDWYTVIKGKCQWYWKECMYWNTYNKHILMAHVGIDVFLYQCLPPRKA